MINIIAVTTYFASLFLYMFINHLAEGIESIRDHIKIDEEDMKMPNQN